LDRRDGASARSGGLILRVPDEKLAEVFDQGFTVIEGFLEKDVLAEAQEALWTIYPKPEEYFANPDAHPEFGRSQFAGIRLFPYRPWALSRLPVNPDLVDAAERLLKSEDIEIYKVELWAKYSGAINYDQPMHRDYGNHTLVVPREDGAFTQFTTFLFLSDVTELDGPTKIVPKAAGKKVPIFPNGLPYGEMFDEEVSLTCPAGSLMIYKTDILHRGSNFGGPGRSRFAMLMDFQKRGWRWNGKMSWPDHADKPGFKRSIVQMTPRQRDLFGWPPIGSEYWNEQTLRDVASRYPGIDLRPYGAKT
jgi:hypothetical protein